MAGRGDLGPGFGPPVMGAVRDESRATFSRLGYSRETLVPRMQAKCARVSLFWKYV
jgi:hypothetical protein